MNWVSILGKISVWIILLPLIVGAIRLSKLDRDSKLIFTIVLIGTIPQVLNPFLKGTPELNLLYNLYTPLEFFIYWTIFYLNIRNGGFKKVCIGILILFIGLSVYLILLNDIFVFITNWVVINNIFQLVLVGFCLLTFYNDDEAGFTTGKPLFWFIIGIILYASCTVVFYSLWNYMKRNPEVALTSLNVVHHVFNIILYLLFAYGYIVNSRGRKFNYTDA